MPKYGRESKETKIRDAIRDMLKARKWRSHIMHGNAYQFGIPDLYCMHREYGQRWIDAKVAGKYSFTKAQKQTWPIWHFQYKVGIWILTGDEQNQYDRLFGPPNWLDYWKKSWGDPKKYLDGPDIDVILAKIGEEQLDKSEG